MAALKKAEEEEKLGRVRRLEARQKREEEDRMKREAAREKRRLDREERERKAQAGEEEEWDEIPQMPACSLANFASSSGRTQARRSTSSEMTHNNAKPPLKGPKPSQDGREQRPLHRR
jgi:hypothetical protein